MRTQQGEGYARRNSSTGLQRAARCGVTGQVDGGRRGPKQGERHASSIGRAGRSQNDPHGSQPAPQRGITQHNQTSTAACGRGASPAPRPPSGLPPGFPPAGAEPTALLLSFAAHSAPHCQQPVMLSTIGHSTSTKRWLPAYNAAAPSTPKPTTMSLPSPLTAATATAQLPQRLHSAQGHSNSVPLGRRGST
jgi:hypothetical protein